MFTHEYFMKMALQEADTALEKDEVPIGCVIVSNDRVIARAHNLTETLNDVTAHAEMQAITSAANFLGGKYLQNCTLYVTLEPCLMCVGAMIQARIKRLVFGAYDTRFGVITSQWTLLKGRNHTFDFTYGLLAETCAEKLQKFFKHKRLQSTKLFD